MLRRGGRVLPDARLDHHGVCAGGNGVACPQAGRPAEIDLTVPHRRIDQEAALVAHGAGHHPRRLRHDVTNRHAALPRHERAAIDLELAHDQHLPQRDLERRIGLGRHLVGVERALGIDEHHLLERVHRAGERVEDAVGEAQQLVGLHTVGGHEPLLERRLRQRQRLAVVQVVVRLLRPPQRGTLDGLGRGARRQDGSEQQREALQSFGHMAHSAIRENFRRTVSFAPTVTVSVCVL